MPKDDPAQDCMVPRTGVEPVRPLTGKRRILSPLCLPISPSRRCAPSHCETKQPRQRNVGGAETWRRDPESNWASRICNPVHNRFAIAPAIPAQSIKKGSVNFPFPELARTSDERRTLRILERETSHALER